MSKKRRDSSDSDRAPDPHRSGGTVRQSRQDARIPPLDPGAEDPVTVYLGLGSNIGDRLAAIDEAVRRLDGMLEGLRRAPRYETAPLEVLDQPRFLNTVVCGSTRLGPEALLDRLHQIETEFGRDRNRELRKGPRPLDIDILLYGDLRISNDRLTIPHPAMKSRGFVLVPLLDLAPDLREPGTGIRYASVLEHLEHQDIIEAE